MSVASRLAKRNYHGLLRHMLQRHRSLYTGAFSSHGGPFYKESIASQSRQPASCQRLLSTPVKSPPEQTEQQKPDGKPEASTTSKTQPGPPQPASAGTKPPSQNPQPMQKPGQRVPLQPSAGQKLQPSSTAQKVQAPGQVPTGQKPQVAQVGQKPPVAKASNLPPPTSGQKVTSAVPPPHKTSTPTASKAKVILATGAVASLVLGLLYWQSPKLHDETAVTGNKGKDESGAFLPQEPNADKAAVDTESSEDVLKVFLKPESVEVETSSVSAAFEAAEYGQKQETEDTVKQDTALTEEKETHSTQESSHPGETEIETKDFVVHSSSDSADGTPTEVVISVAPQKGQQLESDADLVVSVRKEANDSASVSEDLLLQRAHEAIANIYDEKDVAAKPVPQLTGLDVVAAIHAAEQRQAEIDAAVFREQLQKLQEKHQHELREAEHKVQLYQQEIKGLQEIMEKEKLRLDENLKALLEKAELRLQNQLTLMDEARRRQVEEVELLAKSEAMNALIEERAAFLSDIGSVKVHMEAMNIALEAKSEEAREGHEIKQLSLGSFALEDALLNGAPVDKEAALLLKSAGGDPLVEVAVSSLPKQVLEEGTLTPAQLDRRLEEIEGALRELALIPATGGGVLCHLLARLASSLKLSETGLYDDYGVDAVLFKVQSYIRDGKLLDAAETITWGLSGTSAEKLATEWATQARNRAIVEQACALLRAHAAALALSEYSNSG